MLLPLPPLLLAGTLMQICTHRNRFAPSLAKSLGKLKQLLQLLSANKTNVCESRELLEHPSHALCAAFSVAWRAGSGWVGVDWGLVSDNYTQHCVHAFMPFNVNDNNETQRALTSSSSSRWRVVGAQVCKSGVGGQLCIKLWRVPGNLFKLFKLLLTMNMFFGWLMHFSRAIAI